MHDNQPALLTVRQFAAKHGAFTEGSIRWLIFNAGSNCARPDISDAIVRIGRRVLIDEGRFFECIRQRADSERAR